MIRRFPSAWAAAYALIVLTSMSAIKAQTSTATVTGIVTDDSGAVVAGAKVSLANEGTNHRETTETNGTGLYTVPLLPPGQYIITAEKSGFRTTVRTGVALSVAQQVEINLTLHTGVVSEVVTVAASTPLIDATSSSLGQVIDNRRVVDLPLNARSVIQFVALSPGLFPNPDRFNSIQGDSSVSPASFSANGAGDEQNQVLIDGAPDTGGSQGQIHLYPTVDAVQEFRVQTNNYPAEYGQAGGAVINMVIKSGTNQFHGVLWEFLRNEDLNANNFFSNRQRLARGLYRLNQYGGTLGGPVFLPKVYNGHDKTFFFFSYEGTKRTQGGGGAAVSGGGISPIFQSVPTAAQRNGDFSNLRKRKAR